MTQLCFCADSKLSSNLAMFHSNITLLLQSTFSTQCRVCTIGSNVMNQILTIIGSGLNVISKNIIHDIGMMIKDDANFTNSSSLLRKVSTISHGACIGWDER